LDCSLTQAGETLLGLAIPAGRARCGRVGSVTPARVLLSCGAGGGGWVGLAGRGPKGLGPPGLRVVGCRAARPAQVGWQVVGCRGSREPARSAPSIRDREVAWP
jgi:hypothetical protein